MKLLSMIRVQENLASVLLGLVLMALTPWSVAQSLRVAVSGDYEPLVFKRDGELVGIEIDNAREVARILHRELKLVEMPLVEFIPALEIGKVDVVMSGFSITAERQQQVAFAEAYMHIGQMAIVRTTDAVKFSEPRAISQQGVRIAVEPGTTGESFVIKHFGRALIQNFPDAERAFAALRSGVSDVYIHDAPTSWRLATAADQDLFSLYRPMTREGLAWAVRRNNKPLLEQLNAALREMRKSGRLQEIQNEWIPVTVQVR
jgi:polar amino acid transport system substrate-binding protein